MVTFPVVLKSPSIHHLIALFDDVIRPIAELILLLQQLGPRWCPYCCTWPFTLPPDISTIAFINYQIDFWNFLTLFSCWIHFLLFLTHSKIFSQFIPRNRPFAQASTFVHFSYFRFLIFTTQCTWVCLDYSENPWGLIYFLLSISIVHSSCQLLHAYHLFPQIWFLMHFIFLVLLRLSGCFLLDLKCSVFILAIYVQVTYLCFRFWCSWFCWELFFQFFEFNSFHFGLFGFY